MIIGKNTFVSQVILILQNEVRGRPRFDLIVRLSSNTGVTRVYTTCDQGGEGVNTRYTVNSTESADPHHRGTLGSRTPPVLFP